MSSPAANSGSDSDALATSNSPPVCLFRAAGFSAASALGGSIYGLGKGLVQKKGMEASLGESVSCAKTFAILAGVNNLVICFLKSLRRKDDLINAGIGGCCAGAALSLTGAPHEALGNCLTFGAISVFYEGVFKQQKAAIARASAPKTRSSKDHGVLLPLTVPLPNELQESFSNFCKSMKERMKVN